MLIHITPKLFRPMNAATSCTLVDVAVPELDLILREGYEVVARLVACRRTGQKATAGLLLETSAHLNSFTVITRWAIDGAAVITHCVQNVVLDNDYDAVTDSMVLWGAMSEGLGGFPDRWPAELKGRVPAHAQPRMDVLKHDAESRQGDVSDTISSAGMVHERHERFRVPTIERDRLLWPRGLGRDRMPPVTSAFVSHHQLTMACP